MAPSANKPKSSLANYLNNPCHNCRRRRLRCDRSRPICNKCSSSGRECLGYDKLFIWTQCAGTRVPGQAQGGVRSAAASTTTTAASATTATTARRTGHRTTASSPSIVFAPVPVFASFDGPSYSTPACVSDSLDSVSGDAQQPSTALTVTATPSSTADDCTDTAPAHAAVAVPACRPTSLTDPSFKDLDEPSRRYLAHCWSIPFLLSSFLFTPLLLLAVLFPTFSTPYCPIHACSFFVPWARCLFLFRPVLRGTSFTFHRLFTLSRNNLRDAN